MRNSLARGPDMPRLAPRTPWHRMAAPTLALTLTGLSSMAAPAAATHPRADPALLHDLMGWASRFSGLASPATLPRLQALSATDLAQRVCPEQPHHCRTLVAVYDTDTQSVLYADTLDLRDETDQSFLVHEFVHYLQHLQHGNSLFADCPAVMAAEAQAYAVQNRYLAHFKQWRRVGEVLRFTHCHAAAAEPTVRPGEPAALTSRSHQGPGAPDPVSPGQPLPSTDDPDRLRATPRTPRPQRRTRHGV